LSTITYESKQNRANEQYNKCSSSASTNHINNNYDYQSNYYASLQRREMRKNIRKHQSEKYNVYAVFTFIFCLLFLKIFLDNFNVLFANKLINQNIQAPSDMSYLYNTEYKLANGSDFLSTRFLNEINTANPLMKSPVLTQKMNNLTYRLKNLSAAYPSLETGIFIWDFNTGKYVDINADEVFPTASVIKLPVMYQLFRRIEKGFIGLDDKISMENYEIAEGSGFLQYSPPGRVLSYKQLATLMIQESDNTATNMILTSLGGMNELNREIKRWGLKSTSLSNWLPDLTGTNVSSPRDLSTILYNIDNEDLLSLKSRAEIINIMSHVRNRYLIQAGIPDNASFIHKTGDIGTMLGDAGIVELPDGRKYIISIMVKRPWNSFQAKQFIVDASKTVYNSYMARNQ